MLLDDMIYFHARWQVVLLKCKKVNQVINEKLIFKLIYQIQI